MFFRRCWETSSYDIGNDMMIDVVETFDMYEAWIYQTKYGTKYYMFGVQKKVTNKEDFCNMVISQMDEYIKLYHKDIID